MSAENMPNPTTSGSATVAGTNYRRSKFKPKEKLTRAPRKGDLARELNNVRLKNYPDIYDYWIAKKKIRRKHKHFWANAFPRKPKIMSINNVGHLLCKQCKADISGQAIEWLYQDFYTASDMKRICNVSDRAVRKWANRDRRVVRIRLKYKGHAQKLVLFPAFVAQQYYEKHKYMLERSKSGRLGAPGKELADKWPEIHRLKMNDADSFKIIVKE